MSNSIDDSDANRLQHAKPLSSSDRSQEVTMSDPTDASSPKQLQPTKPLHDDATRLFIHSPLMFLHKHFPNPDCPPTNRSDRAPVLIPTPDILSLEFDDFTVQINNLRNAIGRIPNLAGRFSNRVSVVCWKQDLGDALDEGYAYLLRHCTPKDPWLRTQMGWATILAEFDFERMVRYFWLKVDGDSTRGTIEPAPEKTPEPIRIEDWNWYNGFPTLSERDALRAVVDGVPGLNMVEMRYPDDEKIALWYTIIGWHDEAGLMRWHDESLGLEVPEEPVVDLAEMDLVAGAVEVMEQLLLLADEAEQNDGDETWMAGIEYEESVTDLIARNRQTAVEMQVGACGEYLPPDHPAANNQMEQFEDKEKPVASVAKPGKLKETKKIKSEVKEESVANSAGLSMDIDPHPSHDGAQAWLQRIMPDFKLNHKDSAIARASAFANSTEFFSSTRGVWVMYFENMHAGTCNDGSGPFMNLVVGKFYAEHSAIGAVFNFSNTGSIGMILTTVEEPPTPEVVNGGLGINNWKGIDSAGQIAEQHSDQNSDSSRKRKADGEVSPISSKKRRGDGQDTDTEVEVQAYSRCLYLYLFNPMDPDYLPIQYAGHVDLDAFGTSGHGELVHPDGHPQPISIFKVADTKEMGVELFKEYGLEGRRGEFGEFKDLFTVTS